MNHIENARKLRPIMEQAVKSLDDATASRAVEFHPEMQYDGKLIPAKTRINWKGKLYKSKVNGNCYNPDVYPDNWENV